MSEYFDTQKWFDDMLAQEQAAFRKSNPKRANGEYATFAKATGYLRNSFGADWATNGASGTIKVAGMTVFVEGGLRVDPVTDEQYAMVKKVSSRSRSAWNLRLS